MHRQTIDPGVPDVVRRQGGASCRWSVWGEVGGSGEEGGHLVSSDRVVGAEPGVGRRVAADGHSGGSDLLDCLFEEVAVVVGEPVVVGHRIVEGSGQHGGHLSPGHVPFRAEPVVGRGVAALGYPGGAETVDPSFECAGFVVDEIVVGGGAEIEGSGQEHCHLATGDGPIWTEAIIDRRVAPTGDALGGDGLDAPLVDIPIVIDKRASRRKHRQEHRQQQRMHR